MQQKLNSSVFLTHFPWNQYMHLCGNCNIFAKKLIKKTIKESLHNITLYKQIQGLISKMSGSNLSVRFKHIFFHHFYIILPPSDIPTTSLQSTMINQLCPSSENSLNYLFIYWIFFPIIWKLRFGLCYCDISVISTITLKTVYMT